MAHKYVRIVTPEQFAAIKEDDRLLVFPTHGNPKAEKEIVFDNYPNGEYYLYEAGKIIIDKSEQKVLIVRIIYPREYKPTIKNVSDILNGYWWLKIS